MPARKNDRPSDETTALRYLAEATLQRGSYSNLVVINHTPEEFILDFLMQFGGDAQLVSRVILSPEHAERLAKALTANIEKRGAFKAEEAGSSPKKKKVSSRKAKPHETAKPRGKKRGRSGGAS